MFLWPTKYSEFVWISVDNKRKNETGALQCVIENDIYKNCETDSYESRRSDIQADRSNHHENYYRNIQQHDDEVPMAQDRNKTNNNKTHNLRTT
jgi:hypothetical protein